MKRFFFLMLAAALCSCGGKPAGGNAVRAAGEITEPPENAAESSADESAALRAAEADGQKRADAIRTFVAALPAEERAAQLFLVNVEGSGEYRAVESRADGAPLVPGGALLFSFNIAGTAAEVAAYTESMRAFARSRSLVPPFVAVDQEGGDVNRLRGITSVLWSAQKVAAQFTVAGAADLYAAQAAQLHALGIDMNLAPVVEVATAENSEFLGTRSFGSLQTVLDYADAEIAAFEQNGVAVCLKHFPGNSATDPHVGLPGIDVPPERAESFTAPFARLAPGASAVLMSHAIARAGGAHAAETAMPACFSPYWIGQLRGGAATGFGGLVVSDDIFMGALAAHGYPPETAAVQALRAGVDVIMLSEKKFGGVVRQLLSEAERDPDFSARIDESAARVIAFKVQAGILALQEDGEGWRVVPGEARAFDDAAFSAAYRAGVAVYDRGCK